MLLIFDELLQTSKVDPEDHGDTDEDVSDTTPMMQESDSSGLIEQSVNEGRLKALKQRFRYCDYCEVEVISKLLLFMVFQCFKHVRYR